MRPFISKSHFVTICPIDWLPDDKKGLFFFYLTQAYQKADVKRSEERRGKKGRKQDRFSKLHISWNSSVDLTMENE